jgi:hypothetical protein
MNMAEQIITEGKFSGLFPGWGEIRVITTRINEKQEIRIMADTDGTYFNQHKDFLFKSLDESIERQGLTTLFSVSIAGCDLMGSCLYTAGVCTVNSGKV